MATKRKPPRQNSEPVAAARKFGPGNNPGGRPREEREVARALRLHGDALVNALIKQALKGNVAAIKEAFDRSFGKAKQTIEVTGKDGQPLRVDAALLRRIPTEKLELMRQALADAEREAGGAQTSARPSDAEVRAITKNAATASDAERMLLEAKP